MSVFLQDLEQHYPDIKFVKDNAFFWSARKQEVHYANYISQEDVWSLLHELGHALLKHSTYLFDIELLSMEVAAWHKAKSIANSFNLPIDNDYMEDCIDSYRDWVNKRSLCPTCRVLGLQKSRIEYQCINCDSRWKVSQNRLCRPYRTKIKEECA